MNCSRVLLVVTFVSLAILVSASAVPVFAQTQSPATAASITTSTDKSSYSLGDTIIISGQIQAIVPGNQLTVEILDPNNNLVSVQQIDVSQDGKYTDSIPAVGALWKLNGAYTVKVIYASNVTAQTTFQFTGSDGGPTHEQLPPSSSIIPPSTPTIPPTISSKLPSWVRHIFIYYGQGDVSEDELLGAIKFLINQGIMKLN
ncbi:MAG: hypothetical protein D4R72_02615 [Nitrosopumilales archaeon]|nr:MAG: hypothetical protein D4R72_02615 [Nitrosopumilales archaeon]